MKKIAITGTIGSGKSECSKLLEQAGYSVFNCDKEVHRMYDTSHEAYQKICDLFPMCVSQIGIDRQAIAKIIFTDQSKKTALEDLIYSYLLPQLLAAMKSESKEFFFAEVPLLFRNGWDQYFDECIMIQVEDEIALDRLVSVRHMTKEDAMKRLASQKGVIHSSIPLTIMTNNETPEELAKQIANWLDMKRGNKCN